MSILKVARMGHPALREKARPIEPRELKTVALQKLIDDMMETMIEYAGVGLAGPQVHEGVRLFVAFLDDDGRGEGEPVAVINPEITVIGSEMLEGWEGCLSVPDIQGRVPRAAHVKVRAMDRHGKRIEIDAEDYPARVVQHETDHLDGILFLDRMRSFGSLTYLQEYSRYHRKRETDEEEDE